MKEKKMNYDKLYDIALSIAIRAHEGQQDKSGRTYVMHPIRVAERCKDPRAKVVALLHDTIEDTEMTAEQLRSEGMPEEIVAAVLSLTRQTGEDYDEYVRRAAENAISREVKMADLEDNMDVRRLKTITDEDMERLRKYHRAWHFLNDALKNLD